MAPLNCLLVLLTLGVATCAKHSQDEKDIRALLDDLFDRMGKPEKNGVTNTQLFAPNGLLSIAGKTARGYVEIEAEQLEIYDHHYRIEDYHVDPLYVNGDSASAKVTGAENIDGVQQDFEDNFAFRKVGGKWKIEALIVFLNTELSENSN